jgi:hypothetical protein
MQPRTKSLPSRFVFVVSFLWQMSHSKRASCVRRFELASAIGSVVTTAFVTAEGLGGGTSEP